MDAAALLRALASTIDDRRWSDLPALLAPDFRTRLVHTGETFDRSAWIRFNADYPGFGQMVLEDAEPPEGTRTSPDSGRSPVPGSDATRDSTGGGREA